MDGNEIAYAAACGFVEVDKGWSMPVRAIPSGGWCRAISICGTSVALSWGRLMLLLATIVLLYCSPGGPVTVRVDTQVELQAAAESFMETRHCSDVFMDEMKKGGAIVATMACGARA
jgi:hypothetical protein